jgi:hypothetical protein
MAAILALALAATIAVAMPAAASGSRMAVVVSMGDSFISGEGGRWMGNGSQSFGTRAGTDRAAFACGPAGCKHDPHLVYGDSEDNGCHRSDVAPIRSVPVPAVKPVNLACSGAQTENIWSATAGGQSLRGEAPQADQLAFVARHADVRMIVLTVGANDVGFGGLVIRCALDWARSSPEDPRYCRGSAQAEIDAALPDMERDLRKALAQVRAVMAAAGYTSADYRLVVMDYTSPFPSGPHLRYPESGWSRLSEGGCPLWDLDASWAVERATPAIAAAMRAAAGSVRAEFLDVQHALDEHQVCDRHSRRVGPAGPSPLSAEWVRRLDFTQGSVRESLHPNAYGQRAIGACIGLLYGQAPGDYACHDTPSRSYAGGMRLDRLKS